MYKNSSKIFKPDSVIKTLILCIFTLGCYLIYKLYYFSKAINHNTELKISKAFIAVTISFFSFSFVSLIYGLVHFDDPLIFKSHLVIHIISSILDITWIIMVRNRINIIIGANKDKNLMLNPFITSIFHVVYMQYKINQSLLKPHT